MLKMLEVDTDFAKKVDVPAVSTLRELGTVLQESRLFSSDNINRSLRDIQTRTGSDDIGVGIKTILDCIFEAKAGGAESDIAETFTDLLLENVEEMKG